MSLLTSFCALTSCPSRLYIYLRSWLGFYGDAVSVTEFLERHLRDAFGRFRWFPEPRPLAAEYAVRIL